VTLKEGEDLNATFALETGNTATISGAVSAASAIELHEIAMIRHSTEQDSTVMTYIETLFRNEFDGKEFQIRNVPPGTYDLLPLASVRDSTGSFHPNTTLSVPVEVNGRDIQGIVVSIHVADLAGKITSEDPLPRLPPLRLESRGKVSERSALPLASMAADGTFKFSSVPEGDYFVNFNQFAPDVYLSDIRQGGRSVYDSGTIHVGSNSAEPVEFVFESGSQTIEGDVKNGTKGAEGAVVVVPDAPNRQNPALYQAKATDASGHFRLGIVPPGRYKLFAWDSIPDGIYRDAAFLAQYESRGVPVTVTKGNSLKVNLDLISAK
jgi:hypothetical protein